MTMAFDYIIDICVMFVITAEGDNHSRVAYDLFQDTCE